MSIIAEIRAGTSGTRRCEIAANSGEVGWFGGFSRSSGGGADSGCGFRTSLVPVVDSGSDIIATTPPAGSLPSTSLAPSSLCPTLISATSPFPCSVLSIFVSACSAIAGRTESTSLEAVTPDRRTLRNVSRLRSSDRLHENW